MRLRVRKHRIARRGFARTTFVATRLATIRAWRARQRKKAAAWMACADPLRTTPIRMANARMDGATGKTSASITMGMLAPRRPNACPIIVSMAFAAAIFAWALVKRVARPRKVAASTAFVAISRSARTPTENARTAELAMPRARAPRALPNSPMAPRARRLRNAIPDIVRTASAAIVGVWAIVRRVRRPKKAAAPMARAATSNTTPTQTTNAGAVHAMERVCASNTTGFHARRQRSVYRGIAPMAFAAATYARAFVMRAPR